MKTKRITAIAMAACLSVCLALPAFAAEYKYTVEVSEGLHGEITSGNTSVEIEKGGSWNPNDYTVTATDGYYFKGFHIAGREGLVGAGTINEDTTYVATYGIEGSTTIQYTIHYTDEAGNQLAEDTVYSGNIGDKPVVAYQDIAGYIPRDTYNVTWTLTDDPNQEFTFVYIPTTTTTVTTTTVTTPAEGTAAAETTTGAAGTTAGTTTGAAGAAGTAAGAAAGGADAGDTGAAGPADIVDLDDQDVPLAGVDNTGGDNGDGTGVEGDETTINDNQTPLAGMSTAAKAGIGVIIAAAIIALITALLLRVRMKNKEDGEQSLL